MSFMGMNQYHGQMADEYDYDDTDDFFDSNHMYNNSNSYGADDSEGRYLIEIVIKMLCFIKINFFISDTEEASESEYGRTGRSHDEPLEIKEQ